MTALRKPKPKLCKAKGCDNKFTPFNSFEAWCSPKCGTEIAMEKLAKKARRQAIEQNRERILKKRERVAAKKKFKDNDKGHQTKLTQAVFNRWVRLRDSGLPCISCGIEYGKVEAGHYRSRGAAPELRFEPLNVHSQCSQCNNSKSGNIADYRIGLIKKIGVENVEWVEGPHEPRKYTCEDLIDMRKYYNKLLRESGS